MALSQAEESDHHLEQARAYKNLGIASYKANKPVDQTLKLLKKSVDVARTAGDFSIQVSSINVIALTYLNSGQKKKALNYFYQAEELHRTQIKENDYQRGLIYGNISQAYDALGNHEKAREYCEKVIQYAEEYGFIKLYPIYARSYANHLVREGQHASAVAVIKKAQNISLEIEDTQSSVQLYMGLSNLYQENSQYDKALEIVNEAIDKSTKEQLHKEAGMATLMKIKLLQELGKSEEALELALSQYVESENRGLLNHQAEISAILSNLLRAEGNYEDALRYADIEKDLMLEAREQKYNDLIAKHEAKYENELNQSEISALHVENELKEKMNSRLFLLLFLSLGFCGLSLAFYYRKKVAELELATKNIELEKYIESNIQLEQFAHMASHDLRTPLRTVKSFAALLRTKAKDKLNTREIEFLQFIENGTDQMSDLLRDLLHYSDANSQEVKSQKIDCSALFQTVLTKFERRLAEEDVSVTIEQLPPYIAGDTLKLDRVITNLISNALKFTSKDRPTVVNISSEELEDHYKFTIADNGIGIAGTCLLQIFEPYKKLHVKDEYCGTGMGLAITKKIIERHGGQVSVQSQVDVGTEISFTLPKNNSVTILPVANKALQTNAELALA